ncbi:MAG: LytTR family DNA-binding domain-containing protein [Bacteroidota bacterium]
MKSTTYNLMKFLGNPDQITHLEAHKNYSNIYFSDGTSKLVAYNLKKFEDYLSNNLAFKRVHKSYIVNKNFISKISEDGMRINLNNKIVIPVSYN